MMGLFTNRWLACLWNAVVVPRVEGAVISRVMTKRSASSLPSPSPSLRPSPSNCGLNAGQQAVVKAALSILVNKAVMLGCPLPRHGGWTTYIIVPLTHAKKRWRLRQTAGLPVFFDDETDLIRELQTMCSSRSEPDISQVLLEMKQQTHRRVSIIL
ncbi:hypothetical protein XENOCAPTIV_002480 [Xenoophorus captivus]|uniref:Uncharacterized protein n=1 Tax=Xenoophorus captivus TaxID=1517983 RepID=A0ABV0S6M6_9TELE